MDLTLGGLGKGKVELGFDLLGQMPVLAGQIRKGSKLSVYLKIMNDIYFKIVCLIMLLYKD